MPIASTSYDQFDMNSTSLQSPLPPLVPPLVAPDRRPFLRPDGKVISGRTSKEWIKDGLTGVVVRNGDSVLKIPKIFDLNSAVGDERLQTELENEYSLQCYDTEIQVYYRLGHLPGIVEVYSISHAGIELEYLKNGDLEQFLERHPPTDDFWVQLQHLKREWIYTVVDTVSRLHEKRVVMLDLAVRNILVSDDLSLRLCDFGDTLLLPEHADVTIAQRDGFLAVQQDIFALGWVLYSIAVGKAHHSHLSRRYSVHDDKKRARIEAFEANMFDAKDGTGDLIRTTDTSCDKEDGSTLWLLSWPQNLPSTEDVLFGEVIRKCWTEKGYDNVSLVLEDVRLLLASLLL
jgi:hypothetical protein